MPVSACIIATDDLHILSYGGYLTVPILHEVVFRASSIAAPRPDFKQCWRCQIKSVLRQLNYVIEIS